jgi:hypothetical protein
MSDPSADFKALLELTGGVQVKSADHPDDRQQRHRLEKSVVWLIGAIAGFAALILMLSFYVRCLKSEPIGLLVFSSWFLEEPWGLP